MTVIDRRDSLGEFPFVRWLIVTICLSALSVRADEFELNVRTTEPLTPAEQATRFHVPPGFRVTLFAAEPDLQKPMNMAFDGRGRLWVSGSIEYPYAAAEGQGRDAIRILEDTNNDGTADRITTFAEGLNIPMGLYPYGDGVIAYSLSSIDYFRDTDGDGRADHRESLLGPLARPVDTHGMQNAFRRGYDGWLYVNHGYANTTALRARDGSNITLHSGNTYRLRVDGSHIEQFTWGQVNPFGSAWTDQGDLITADCHSKPLTLLLRGAYYSSFGKPDDGLGFAPDLLDHSHGSTGLAGVAFLDDERWPAAYRSSLLVGNVVTSRVHRDRLAFQGMTPRAIEEADFLTCDDPWFRPVDLQLGPDGAVYVADFYNRIIGHYEVPLEHPGRDRARGRIWRIDYVGDSSATANITPRDDRAARPTLEQLVAQLNDGNITRRMLATDAMTDQWGLRSVETLRQCLLEQQATNRDDRWHQRVHARWCLFRLGQLNDEELADAVEDRHPTARMHAQRMLAEWPGDWTDAQRTWALRGLTDTDPQVIRCAIDALGQHGNQRQMEPLLALWDRLPANDLLGRHAVRVALRNHLRDEAICAALLDANAPPITADHERLLAEVGLAAPHAATSRLLIHYLQRPDVPRETFERLLPAAIRFLKPDQFEQAATLARHHAGNNVPLQSRLFLDMHRSLARPDDTIARRLDDWGREITRQLGEHLRASTPTWKAMDGLTLWGLETRRSSTGVAQPFLSTLPGGESVTGRVVSPVFAAPDRLAFDLCGHRGDPSRPARDATNERLSEEEPTQDTYVQLRLVDRQQIVARAVPPRQDHAVRIAWDLQAWQGQPVVLEVVDRLDHVAYAWLAVSQFEPPVVSLPQVDLREAAVAQQNLVELIDRLAQREEFPELQRIVREGLSLTARSMAAQALARHQSHRDWLPLARLLEDGELPETVRDELAAALLAEDNEGVQRATQQAFRVLPQDRQFLLARQMATLASSGAQLLAMIEAGHANSRLLLRISLREALLAQPIENVQERIERILRSLPSEGDLLEDHLLATLQQVVLGTGSAERGQPLFAKHCSACHQVGGQGALVAPQLDGIGTRGPQRVIEDVLAPYRNVDASFRTTVVTLRDGRVLSGLIKGREGARWTMIDTQGKSLEIDPAEIEEEQTSTASIMPDNFATSLSPQERADLLAFLLARRDGPSK